MNLYLISGLGADERIFRNLCFQKGCQVHYLKWLEPLSVKETLVDYCRRLGSNIDHTNPFILIGLSFGGMVACALNDILKPEKTILVSSIAVRSELPGMYKIAGMLGLTCILPLRLPSFMMKVLEWYMGVMTTEDKELVNQFIKDGSPRFLRWAMIQAANWRYSTAPNNLYQVHGTKDRIFRIG